MAFAQSHPLFFPHCFILQSEGFLKWEIPKSPWVSIRIHGPWRLDDAKGYVHDLGNLHMRLFHAFPVNVPFNPRSLPWVWVWGLPLALAHATWDNWDHHNTCRGRLIGGKGAEDYGRSHQSTWRSYIFSYSENLGFAPLCLCMVG